MSGYPSARAAFVAATLVALPGAAFANVIIEFSGPSGLAAEADFELLDPTTLQIRLTNTSTGVPDGFDNSDQLLTSISWDFGALGAGADDPTITGGLVVIGPGSSTVNFDSGIYGPGTDVSGEYGFSNIGGTGLLQNFITAMSAHATRFGGPNLDGPESLDGPQGGLVADPMPVPLGGLGAIQNGILATLTLSDPIFDLEFLRDNGVRIEFGSDAAFVMPGPGGAAILLMAAGGLRRRRRA